MPRHWHIGCQYRCYNRYQWSCPRLLLCLLPTILVTHQVFVLLKGEEKDADCVFIGRAVDADPIEKRGTKWRDIVTIAATIYRNLNRKNQKIDRRYQGNCLISRWPTHHGQPFTIPQTATLLTRLQLLLLLL